MVADLLAAIASLLLLGASFVSQADRIAFRSGWLHGVRADGWFELRRSPAHPDIDELPGVLQSRVYCTGGSRAIAIDYRTVGCQR